MQCRRRAVSVIARVSIPPLDVRSLPAWQVTMEDNELHLGGTVLKYDAVTEMMTGAIPESVVPVHRISLIPTRVASAEPAVNDRDED